MLQALNTLYFKKTTHHRLIQFIWLLLFSLISFLLSILQIHKRIIKLINHIFLLDFKSPRNEKKWFWFPLFVHKLLDCILIPEVLSFVILLIKPNSRLLNNIELTEAKKIFGGDFPYWKVSVDEHSIFAYLGARFNGSEHLGVVVFNTINFNRTISCSPFNYDMEWLIHELVHIKQYNSVGSSYIFYSLYAQHTSGYVLPNEPLKEINEYNFEQQAEVYRIVYKRKKGNKLSSLPFKENISFI